MPREVAIAGLAVTAWLALDGNIYAEIFLPVFAISTLSHVLQRVGREKEAWRAAKRLEKRVDALTPAEKVVRLPYFEHQTVAMWLPVADPVVSALVQEGILRVVNWQPRMDDFMGGGPLHYSVAIRPDIREYLNDDRHFARVFAEFLPPEK